MRDGPDVTIAQQRERFRAWVHAQVGSAPVDVIETHISLVALGPDRVWKLRKPVRFPFVDCSTADARRSLSEREVTLNRRFAPDVYLGVRPLVVDGVAVDAIVEMVRLPAARRLARLAVEQRSVPCVAEVADTLARVHRAATTSPEIERAASPGRIQRLWDDNLTELERFTPAPIDPAVLAGIGVDARRYLAGRAALLEERIATGRIRDGHGDLLADDVFCLDDGPRLLDCLEFDDELRYGDVLADVAFLAMDLERLGRADLAGILLDRYRAVTGDRWPPSLQHCYVAYRALVRSKVACLRAVEGDADAADVAARLLALAADHLARGRVHLVVIGGPPATGKSTLARAVCERTGWLSLSSDAIRKELGGLAPTTPAPAALDADLYSAGWTARTYEAMLDRAAARLGRGESVVLDASWSDPAQRAAVEQVAASTASVLSQFVCVVPGEVADARARDRARTRHDASDAVGEIATALRERFTAWPDATALDGRETTERLVTRVLDALAGDGTFDSDLTPPKRAS